MTSKRSNWHHLVGSLYDAAMDDTLWTSAVAEIMEQVGADQAALFSLNAGLNAYEPELLNQYVSDDVWNLYQAYYWQRDVWTQRMQITGQLKQGGIVHGDGLIERREFRRTEIYADYAKPNDVEVLMCALLFDGNTPGDPPMMALNLYRPPNSAAFGKHEEALLCGLIPHLQRALRIRWRMGRQNEERSLREHALDHMGQAVALLDESGGVLFANRRAENIFRDGGGPISKNNRFTAAGASGANDIREALRQAASGIGGSMRLANPGTGRQWVITFSPLRIAGAASNQSARILALIAEPARTPAGALPQFAALYRLTPAETGVLEQLLMQESTLAMADALGISIKTLRVHLGNLFAKTHTANQRELVRFFLNHPAS